MSDRRKCRVCKQQNRVMYRCPTCKHAFCSKHVMRTGECWGCARRNSPALQNDVMTLCQVCRGLEPISFVHSFRYGTNLCEKCGIGLDQDLIEKAKESISGKEG